MRLLSIGTSCLDVSIHPLEALPKAGERAVLTHQTIAAAGNALSVAICAKRLGASSALLTGLGTDIAGDIIRSRLDSEGVQLFSARRKRLDTSVSVVTVASGGERRILSYLGANQDLGHQDVLKETRQNRS
jgi:sugar/nucleoside kinase (ribokinase family)